MSSNPSAWQSLRSRTDSWTTKDLDGDAEGECCAVHRKSSNGWLAWPRITVAETRRCHLILRPVRTITITSKFSHQNEAYPSGCGVDAKFRKRRAALRQTSSSSSTVSTSSTGFVFRWAGDDFIGDLVGVPVTRRFKYLKKWVSMNDPTLTRFYINRIH